MKKLTDRQLLELIDTYFAIAGDKAKATTIHDWVHPHINNCCQELADLAPKAYEKYKELGEIK